MGTTATRFEHRPADGIFATAGLAVLVVSGVLASAGSAGSRPMSSTSSTNLPGALYCPVCPFMQPGNPGHRTGGGLANLIVGVPARLR